MYQFAWIGKRHDALSKLTAVIDARRGVPKSWCLRIHLSRDVADQRNEPFAIPKGFTEINDGPYRHSEYLLLGRRYLVTGCARR